MTEKTRAALIGGVTLGLLSSIPPISFANACCCVWVLGSGALAAYLYVRKSPSPVLVGQGAELGVLVGLIGSVVSHSIGIPLALILGDTFNEFMVSAFENFHPQVGEEMRRQAEIARGQTIMQKLLPLLGFAVFHTVIYIAFATLGGLLGVKLFEKRLNTVDNAMPPPPPSDFGGNQPPPASPPAPPPTSNFGG